MFAANLNESSQVSLEHAKPTNRPYRALSYLFGEEIREKNRFLTGVVSRR